MSPELSEALSDLVSSRYPGARVVGVKRLSESAPNTSEGADGTTKSLGYGVSLRVDLETAEGESRRLVFRTSRSDDFGHDRRADRAAQALLAFDTFDSIPQHVPAVDVGVVTQHGRLTSLADAGEFYTLTDYVDGVPYVEDLWRIARERRLRASDRRRCSTLAAYLVDLHARKIDRPGAYRRAIRDLVGHGEGIFGLIDNYPADAPGASLDRLRSLEARSAEWRFRLRERTGRLSRTHGDFHPFNLLFDGADRLALLDASRGCLGDPADDVTCLAVNYAFFALEHEGSWSDAFSVLWSTFWSEYLQGSADRELLEAAPPYLAWRILVLTNPLWYPHIRRETRENLLDFAEATLREGALDPDAIRRLFS